MNLAEFASRWLYSIQHTLQNHLESLRDDLASDDEQVRKRARDEAGEILDWLHPPLPPLSTQERLERVTTASGNEALSDEEKLAAVERAARSTGRRKGRPRTETAQHAIRALSLHLATTLSWREIALDVKGCKHKRPNPERSCVRCGQAIRNAATRLETFLESIGHEFNFKRGVDLDPKTGAELMKIWHVEK